MTAATGSMYVQTATGQWRIRDGDRWIRVDPGDLITCEDGRLFVNGCPGDIWAIEDLDARQVAWAAYKAELRAMI